jgi:hypothetical protein
MKDFLTDADGDLRIVDGHFVIGECSEQNQKSLLLASQGDIRSSPVSGIDILNDLEDEDMDGFQLKVRKQFELDGARLKQCVIGQDGMINIDAPYK